MKRCNKCLKIKGYSEFYKNSHNKKNYIQPCIDCIYPEKVYICDRCGNEWKAEKRGRSGTHKRADKLCNNCYAYHRQAYNLWHVVKHRAKKKNLKFDLDLLEIESLLKQPCPKTGLSFSIGQKNGQNYKNRNPLTPSIDKIDPYGDYTKDNVQIVCWWYNVSKQQFSDEEILKFCQAVINTYNTGHARIADLQTH